MERSVDRRDFRDFFIITICQRSKENGLQEEDSEGNHTWDGDGREAWVEGRTKVPLFVRNARHKKEESRVGRCARLSIVWK